MNFENILLEKEDRTAIITLNRPEKLNAINHQMEEEMWLALKDVATDDNIVALILTGSGRGFCAGAELSGWESGEIQTTPAERRWFERYDPASITQLLAVIRSLGKPTICALNGVAAGAGTVFALQCDIIIASEQARFRVAFTRIGLPPEYGQAYLLAKRVGTHRALELAYTNDIIDAKEMERIGLVNKVVPHDDLLKSAKDMIKKMLMIPPATLAMTKLGVYNGLAAPGIESHFEFNHALGFRPSVEDRLEAGKSFMEKRAPIYKGK